MDKTIIVLLIVLALTELVREIKKMITQLFAAEG